MQKSPVHAVKEIPAYAAMTVFRTTLNSIKPGEYQIKITAVEYVTYVSMVNIKSNDTKKTNIVLKNDEITNKEWGCPITPMVNNYQTVTIRIIDSFELTHH